MSDIEEDIKRCEKLTEPQNANWIGISNQMAIAGALARIKELEEEKKKYIVQLTDKEHRNLVDTIRKEAKQEFKQKVKEKLECIEDYFDRLNGSDEDIEYIRNIKKELLEDK